MFAYFYVDSLMYGNLTEDVSIILIRLDRFDKYRYIVAIDRIYDDVSKKISTKSSLPTNLS
jgi:hypothetical protein